MSEQKTYVKYFILSRNNKKLWDKIARPRENSIQVTRVDTFPDLYYILR